MPCPVDPDWLHRHETGLPGRIRDRLPYFGEHPTARLSGEKLRTRKCEGCGQDRYYAPQVRELYWNKTRKRRVPLAEAARAAGLGRRAARRAAQAGRVEPTGGGGKRQHAYVTVHACQHLADTTDSRGRPRLPDPPPADGLPIRELVEKHQVPKPTLRQWLSWDPHPALGYKIRCGTGAFTTAARNGRTYQYRGLLASEGDVDKCARAVREPLHFPFPGQAGKWLAKGADRDRGGKQRHAGIYLDADGKLCYTELQAEEMYGIPRGVLSLDCYREKLDRREVIWPGSHPRWRIAVITKESLDALDALRKGEAGGGRWLEPGMIWHDAQGTWFSSWWLAQRLAAQLGMPADPANRPALLKKVEHLLRRSGLLTRFKRVPAGGAGAPKPGAPKMVHHEGEVYPLLGWPPGPPDPAPAGAGGAAAPPDRFTWPATPDAESGDAGLAARVEELHREVRGLAEAVGRAAPVQGPGPASGRAAGAALAPRWVAEERQLWLGDRLLKRFSAQAGSQMAVIEAFHRADWAHRVESPFRSEGPRGGVLWNPEKLDNARKWLNRSLPEGTIRFHLDGTGKGVCWELRRALEGAGG